MYYIKAIKSVYFYTKHIVLNCLLEMYSVNVLCPSFCYTKSLYQIVFWKFKGQLVFFSRLS